MLEPASTDVLEAIELIRSRVKDQFAWFEAKAVREKRRAVYLQFFQIITLAPVSPLIMFGAENKTILLGAALLATVALAISVINQIINPGSRWEQYRLMRDELRRQLFELELRTATLGEEPDAEQLQEIYRRFKELLERQYSLWYFAEPSELTIPPKEDDLR